MQLSSVLYFVTLLRVILPVQFGDPFATISACRKTAIFLFALRQTCFTWVAKSNVGVRYSPRCLRTVTLTIWCWLNKTGGELNYDFLETIISLDLSLLKVTFQVVTQTSILAKSLLICAVVLAALRCAALLSGLSGHLVLHPHGGAHPFLCSHQPAELSAGARC